MNNEILIAPRKNKFLSLLCFLTILFNSLILYRASLMFEFEKNDGMYGLLSSLGNSNEIFIIYWLIPVLLVTYILIKNYFFFEKISKNDNSLIIEKNTLGLKTIINIYINEQTEITYEKNKIDIYLEERLTFMKNNKFGRIIIKDRSKKYSIGYPIGENKAKQIIENILNKNL